jgi:flagellar motor switch protein FliG
MSTVVAAYNDQPDRSQGRSTREKVAILLASLDNSLAVELLKKLGTEEAKQILESSAGLGPLTFGDVQPLVDEFADGFAEALGISASREQLMALLEAAFTSDQIASFLGRAVEKPSGFSWARFTLEMEPVLVPYVLDEHPQTAALVLSKLGPDLAARCLEKLPSALRTSVMSRILHIEEVSRPALEVLEKVIQEDLLGEKTGGGSNARLERLASIINRLDRDQAYELLSDITRLNPEDGASLRKLIFMFEDIAMMAGPHRAKLLDRVPTGMLISALHGADLTLRETLLQSLSARTRRMVESELPAGESQPQKDTPDSRRKIAAMAIEAAKNGELELVAADAASEPAMRS